MSTNKKLSLDVLVVNQPIGQFYMATISAKDLLSISYADVRRMVNKRRDVERYLGIQRPISTRRVNEIKKYIQAKDATFPTAVILAIDERCANYNPRTSTLTLRSYQPEDDEDEKPIRFNRIGKILDGQHRIAAFMNTDQEWDSACDDLGFEFNVALFVGADISEQANIFATVNLAQTKVNKSLAYDLTELAVTRSPHKTCHNVAVALDRELNSPLYQRIKRLGTATPGRSKEPLTQAGFVESLVRFISRDPLSDRNALLDGQRLERADGEELLDTPFRNLFIDKKDLDIAEILLNYFTAIQNTWPKSWDAIEKTGNLLPRSNAFKAFMKYLREDVYLNVVGDDIGRVPKAQDFMPHFQHVELTDRDFTTKNFAPGSGGQSVFLKMLRGELSLDEMLD